MASLREFSWRAEGVLGRLIIGLWFKLTRIRVRGDEAYRALRKAGRPVVLLVWHGKIFIVPYFFRRRGVMPLVSPSRDGEFVARIMDGWGYKILRGSGSHFMRTAWLEMLEELRAGGEVLIVPDGPKGPDRKFKPGAIKLAAETGAALVPFSFAAKRRKVLRSWDRFREAHHAVGALVARAEAAGKRLDQLTLQDFQVVHRHLEADAVRVFDPARALARRELPGAPGPAQCKRQLQRWRKLLA